MTVLETERLVLRHMEAEDTDALAAVLSDPIAMQYYPHAFSREEVAQWVARWMASYDANAYGLYAMVLRKTGKVIGDCGHALQNIDGKSEIEIGYHVRRDLWGHGYATEAARVLLRWAFDTLDLNRVQAETDTRNVASARVLEKLGFVREGTLREDCVVNGEVSDSWVYGLISREWRPSPEPDPTC